MIAMNRRPLNFSQAILAGLQGMGISLAAIHRAARVSPTALIAIFDGRREFNDAQVERLEGFSGRTGAQLAASAVEPGGGHLTDFAESLASAQRAISRTRGARHSRRRATLVTP
jgi:hypothetical protein